MDLASPHTKQQVPTPHAGVGGARGGKAERGSASRGMFHLQQRQLGKGHPSEGSRSRPSSPHSTHMGSGSSATSSIGKRLHAAGAPVVPPRAPQSFLTRKGSEFGVVRPQQVKITSRYTICEKLGEGNTATVRRCIDKVRKAGPVRLWVVGVHVPSVRPTFTDSLALAHAP